MEPFLIPDPSYPEPTPLLPEVEAAVPYPLEALGEVLGGAAAAIVEAVQCLRRLRHNRSLRPLRWRHSLTVTPSGMGSRSPVAVCAYRGRVW